MTLGPAHLRTRLTLWYTSVFGAILLIFIVAATLLLRWQLSSELLRYEVQDMETAEGLLYFTPTGALTIDQRYHNSLQDEMLVHRLMQVMTPEGRILFRNPRLGDLPLGGAPFPREGFHVYNPRTIRLANGVPVLLISHIHSINGKTLLIRIAYSLLPVEEQVRISRDILVLAFFPTLLLAGVGIYRLTLKALLPLEKMATAAEQITADQLSRRLAVENPGDELGHMARVLNGLLARLEASFEQLKRFTADASHELRTPLACLRVAGEVALEKHRSAEEYRETVESMLEEVMRLTHLVDRLLLISRADAGQIALNRTTFCWMDLVQEAVALVGVLADERLQTIDISGDPSIQVYADRYVLRHAMLNLLENAVKYSPEGSTIGLRLSRRADQMAEFSVIDQGPGVPEEDREKIFDRFFRSDSGRARDAGGDGLGLAIARWAVGANGGRLGLAAMETRGSRFFIQLPAHQR
ncbi:MAG: ATP-binding protein [Acidobacteriota bacterium]